MKSEKIYDALNGLRDDQILEGEKPLVKKRPKYLRWAAPLAAALALVILAGAVGLPMLNREARETQAPDTKANTPATNAGIPDGSSAAAPSPTGATPTGATPTGATPTGAAPTGTPDATEANPGADPGSLSFAYSLAHANYPKMAPYANLDDYLWEDFDVDWEAYEAAEAAWRESRRKLREDVVSYADGLDGFLARTVPVFLSGEAGENRICSPLNVWMALSMLTETVDGASRQQLLDVLGISSVEELRSLAASLWKCNYCDDGRLTSLLANSFWLRDGMDYNDETLATLAADYYASSFSGKMGSSDYDEAIRAWINEQTGGLLKDQAGKIKTDDLTVLMLISTIYYKAGWESEFAEWDNEALPFHSPDGDENAEFMYQKLTEQPVYVGESFKALGKGLSGSGQMFFLLPEEGTTPEELLNDPAALAFLNSEQGRAQAERKLYDVHLRVPKFDVSSDLSLIEGLRELGVRDIFDEEISDFTPLTTEEDDLYVSSIQHAARVKIDEQGCEAAAFTAIDVATECIPEPLEELEFTLDRPFLFVVTNSEGLPLFVGTVNHPTQDK